MRACLSKSELSGAAATRLLLGEWHLLRSTRSADSTAALGTCSGRLTGGKGVVAWSPCMRADSFIPGSPEEFSSDQPQCCAVLRRAALLAEGNTNIAVQLLSPLHTVHGFGSCTARHI